MEPPSPAIWLVPLALGALLALSLPAGAAGHEGLPPVLPHDISSDPEFQNISAETEEVSFAVELAKTREYTGEFQVDLHIEDALVAEIEEIWPPNTDRMTVETDEDADRGPGVWEPTVGQHLFNLTVQAEGKSFPLEFGLPMGPDLSVEDTDSPENESSAVRMEPKSPAPGEEVTFEVTVDNRGTWDTPETPAVPVKLFLNGELLGQDSVSQVPSVNESVLTFEDAWEAQPGYHNASLEVETGVIEEIHDGNNRDWFRFTVSENGLAVADLTARPNVAEPGEAVSVEATLVNRGEDPTETTVTGLYRNDVHVAGAETDPLEPGERANVTWELEAPIGAHELKAVPNAEDPPERAPPVPDRATEELVVGPDLGLVVSGADPEHPVEGENVTLHATLANRGSSVGAENVTIGLRAGQEGPIQQRTNVTAPGPDGEQAVSFTLAPEAGSHIFAFVADPDQAVEEAREGNNEGYLSLPVRRDNPEVFIDSLSFTQPRLLPGHPVPASVTVVNVGNRTAQDLVARFTVDGTPLGAESPLGPIEPREEASAQSRNWTPEPGEHTLEVRVGTRQDFAAESPLATASTSVEVEDVTPKIDVGALQVRPQAPEPGQAVHLALELTNEGEATAPGFAVHFAVDGDSIGIQRVDGLEPGQTRTIESPTWTLEGNETEATAHVDPEGRVLPEGGNETTATIQGPTTETPSAGLAAALASLAAAGLLARLRRST